VTGLKLKLRRDPAQQRYLIDPKGRIGPVKLGGKVRRVRGLRLHAVRGHIRSIKVISRRFRSEFGIRRGSSEAKGNHAYPRAALTALKGKAKKTRQYHVDRAIFRLRHGRVVAIALGRVAKR